MAIAATPCNAARGRSNEARDKGPGVFPRNFYPAKSAGSLGARVIALVIRGLKRERRPANKLFPFCFSKQLERFFPASWVIRCEEFRKRLPFLRRRPRSRTIGAGAYRPAAFLDLRSKENRRVTRLIVAPICLRCRGISAPLEIYAAW